MLHSTILCKLTALLIAGSGFCRLLTEPNTSFLPFYDEGSIIIRPREGESTGIPRNNPSIHIEAYYDTCLASVCAYLLHAGTSVKVELCNHTTGENYYYEVSGDGFSFMPIDGNSGRWTIVFTLPSGAIYDGEFNL